MQGPRFKGHFRQELSHQGETNHVEAQKHNIYPTGIVIIPGNAGFCPNGL